MTSHYLNQCWNIINWTIGNKLQWNLNKNLHIFIQENVLENVVWEGLPRQHFQIHFLKWKSLINTNILHFSLSPHTWYCIIVDHRELNVLKTVLLSSIKQILLLQSNLYFEWKIISETHLEIRQAWDVGLQGRITWTPWNWSMGPNSILIKRCSLVYYWSFNNLKSLTQ